MECAHPRHQRQRPPRRVRRTQRSRRSHQGQADQLRLLRRRVQPDGRHDLGFIIGFPWRPTPARSGAEPARDGTDGDLPAALGQPGRARTGVFAAWHGHRPQWCRLDAPREWTHGQLRPQQVHGAAQRTHRHRKPLPRGLDPLPGAGAADQESDRVRQCRVELLHVGGSVQHAGAGRERADQHG